MSTPAETACLRCGNKLSVNNHFALKREKNQLRYKLHSARQANRARETESEQGSSVHRSCRRFVIIASALTHTWPQQVFTICSTTFIIRCDESVHHHNHQQRQQKQQHFLPIGLTTMLMGIKQKVERKREIAKRKHNHTFDATPGSAKLSV